MTRVRQTQLLVLVIAVGLFVLLYFAPKKPAHAPLKEKAPAAARAPETIEAFVKTADGVLGPELKQKQDAYLKNAAGSDKLKWLDSLTGFWDKVKRPDVASYYVEKKAAVTGKAPDWFKAGDRYYYSLRFVENQEEVPSLYASAERCYEKGLKLDSANMDGRIMLAACYVEDGADPMKGIGMLREIEKTDSNNVKLQLNFALFSVKSKQWDRAIRRFQKVLQIDSTYIEAYLHLADAYEQQGDKAHTIEMLEKYVASTNDITSRQEVKKYIQQLKTN